MWLQPGVPALQSYCLAPISAPTWNKLLPRLCVWDWLTAHRMDEPLLWDNKLTHPCKVHPSRACQPTSPPLITLFPPPQNEADQSVLIHLSPDRCQGLSPFTDWLDQDNSTPHIFLPCLLRYKTAGVLPRGKLVYLWFSTWSHRHTEVIQVPDENFRIIGSRSQEVTL